MAQQQPPPTPRLVDRARFLAHLRESGLVPAAEIDRVMAGAPMGDKATALARYLIAQKLITKFQAERLLVGLTDGFVLGQYRILDQLGRGGMGRVYKAEHATMGRVVALKVLSPEMTKTERARDMFHREIRAAGKINHPNVVTAFDANQIGDRCFLVMEFVDGPNLQDLVRRHGRLPVTQACDVVRQAATGLQAAHDLGMVHRDVKPANLLAQRNQTRASPGLYTVKILDFGLARLNEPGDDGPSGSDSTATARQTVMGTPDYLAPEQARSLHATDARSDLYSLGCTFYFLLTGRVPFPDGTTVEKLVRHTAQEPEPVRSIRPEVPAEVAAVVEKLMAKDPAKRYQSGSELAAALTAFTTAENAQWVPIATLAEDSTLRSGARLPRPEVNSVDSDPWSQLDRVEDGDIATLAAASDHTFEDTPIATPGRYQRRPYRSAKSGSGATWWVVGLIGALVTVGALVAIKFILSRAGG